MSIPIVLKIRYTSVTSPWSVTPLLNGCFVTNLGGTCRSTILLMHGWMLRAGSVFGRWWSQDWFFAQSNVDGQPNQQHTNKHRSRTHIISSLSARMVAHFLPSGMRFEQEHLKHLFLHEARLLSPTREGPRPTHCGPQGMSALCVQRVDWTSGHCHWMLRRGSPLKEITIDVLATAVLALLSRGMMVDFPQYRGGSVECASPGEANSKRRRCWSEESNEHVRFSQPAPRFWWPPKACARNFEVQRAACSGR